MTADLLQPANASEIRRLKRISMALACIAVICAAGVAWLASEKMRNSSALPASDEDIVFSRKLFQSTKAYVYVVGTLAGDWIAYKNNTYSILCLPQECIVANTEQIGPRQVSRIDGPVVYPVVRWTDDEVVASDDSLCAKITITIDRRTETLLWVETPINQTEIACKNADNTVRKATMEHSLYWRRPK
jgi:hypothetical protein